MELSVDHANVDLERGTVIITGYDTAEIVSEIGAYDLLREMEYSDIMEFVAEQEEINRELDELAKEDK